MKKTLLLILVLVTKGLLAQKATVVWGDLDKEDKTFERIFEGFNDEIITLTADISGNNGFLGIGESFVFTPRLTRYDKKMRAIKSKTYPLEKKDIQWGGILRTKNLVYLLMKRYNKDANGTTYYAQAVNMITLEKEGDIINFGTFESKPKTLFKKKSESIIQFEMSEDSSRIMIFALTPYKQKENEKYYIGVYDSDMKKLWDKTVELPILDKNIISYDFLLTNDGEVCLLLKKYTVDTKTEVIKINGTITPSYEFQLLVYNKSEDKANEIPIKLNNKFEHTIALRPGKQSKILVFGTYKNSEPGWSSGYFLSEVDIKTSTSSLKIFEPFPQQIIQALDKENQANKKDKDPGISSLFKMNYIGIREDGYYDMILEYYKKTNWDRVIMDGKPLNSPPDYDYGNILIFRMGLDGKSTVYRIPKMQTSTGYFFEASSFMALEYKNKLCLFYNDNKDNITRDMQKKPEECSNFGKSSFVMATIDEKGEITREEIFTNKDLSVTTCTYYSYVLSKNKINLYARKIASLFPGKDCMMGYLELK